MQLSDAEFRSLIPQRGAMSLLAAVLRADAESITCRAQSHRDPANPLREAGMLPGTAGIEYAAQAMAVHGALIERQGPRGGMLAAVREVELQVARLDDIAEDLVISARQLAADSRHGLYEFVVQAGERELLRGRAAVVFTEAEA